MARQTLFALASAMLATVRGAGAEILSCADVECPITPNTTAATCTVVDKTFNSLGIASLDTDVDGLNGLSWVKAVAAEDRTKDERLFDQTFYLGTPDDFDFDSTGACALFFTEVSDRVKFGDGDARNTQGTCGDALSNPCVAALTDRARNVNLTGLSGSAACEALRRDFVGNLDSACSDFAGGSHWGGLKAQALSGDGSPQPISDQQNGTSDCWPVLPKTDDLTLVESANTTGNYDASTIVKNFFSITPILTVFFPGNGSDNLVSGQEAWLTCLKAIDLTTASNETHSPDGGDSAAGRVMGSGSFAVWGGLVTMGVAVLFG